MFFKNILINIFLKYICTYKIIILDFYYNIEFFFQFKEYAFIK